MAWQSPEVVFHLLEITLISAQDLKPPSSASVAANIRRLKTYAIVWVDPSTKLHTLVDRVGGENPTWNEKFLFRVPAGFLANDSSSAVHIEIYAVGLLVDSLVGTVDFLVGNQRLLSKPLGHPSFAAVGIRRPSGRFLGVLNVGTALLPLHRVSSLAADVLLSSRVDAIGYRALMSENFPSHKLRRQRPPAPPAAESSTGQFKGSPPPRVLKERNVETESSPGVEAEATKEESPGFKRTDSLDPSDQNCITTEPPAGDGRS
ncbi:hypothetical protein Taro_017476 [Colocasia esculenta]|uniref:C2 domain-containing protein n=1 Tax=Colocasia esculenta TaxID=4460 RepID=A0A843UTD0_COLES|nr:hypothetical protein [Colocasia esculenta]